MNRNNDSVREAKAYGHVTPQGIAYSLCGGRVFALHPEPRHTNSELREAKRYLTENRNAQGFTIQRINEQ